MTHNLTHIQTLTSNQFDPSPAPLKGPPRLASQLAKRASDFRKQVSKRPLLVFYVFFWQMLSDDARPLLVSMQIRGYV